MKSRISIFLILIIIFGIFAGTFFYKPQKAHAGIFGDIMMALKEFALDTLPKTIARQMMVRLQQEIGRWAQGGFSDENKPFAMTSWKQEVTEALKIASGRFVQEMNLTSLCAPIRISLGEMFNIDIPLGGSVPYSTYAACTLGDIGENIEDFYRNPSISLYGWDTFNELFRPQNNVIGAFLLADERQTEIEDEEIEEVAKEVAAGAGVKNETICTQDDQEACIKICNEKYEPTLPPYGTPNPLYVACVKGCEKSSTGVCLQEKTKKLGSEIKTSVDKAIGSDIEWLITADEITEMINLVFSGLFNKLTHGINGLLTKGTSSTSTVAINQAQYNYNADYKRNLTPEDISETRNSILSNILKSVQQISVTGYVCNEDEMLEPETYQELAADILNEESQHLYTAMEGVNLKADFEVLDNQFAVDNKIDIYGTTWNDIPFTKYPEKCSKIAGKKCVDIVLNLPYEFDENNVNTECTTGCHETINNYRLQCQAKLATCVGNCTDTDPTPCINGCKKTYSNCDGESINKAVADGKCSSYAIGNACLQARYVIDRTKTRCDECFKKYQESCESITEADEKQRCLESACGNYKDIVPVVKPIKDAKDFYNRCASYQTKMSCEVCLKEYFMPANYCDEIYDFINRAFVKYPAYSDPPGILGTIPFDILHAFFGPYYKFSSKDGCIPGSVEAVGALGYLSTGLTCRILPDAKFEKNKTCQDVCNVTEDELKNIADNEPQNLDCNGPIPSAPLSDDWGNTSSWGGVWRAKGYFPGFLYRSYLIYKKTKCCSAFAATESEYNTCRGIIEPTKTCKWSLPVNKEPWCYCDEGQRPLGFTRTGDPLSTGTYGGDCSSDEISTNGNEIYIYTNNDPDSDTFFLGNSVCIETDERTNNTDQNDDGNPDGTPTDATAAPSPIWTQIPNGKTTWTLSNIIKGDYKFGVYHNSNDDVGSGIHVCEKCNPSDPNYNGGYYGTDYDQCTGKTQ